MPKLRSFLYSGNPQTGHQTPGEFREVDDHVWAEFQGDREIWRFFAINEDDDWVILDDPNRHMMVALPKAGGWSYFITINSGNAWTDWIQGARWTQLYPGLATF